MTSLYTMRITFDVVSFALVRLEQQQNDVIDAYTTPDSKVCYTVGIITLPRYGSGVLRPVCLPVCVCLSVREHIFGTTGPTFTHFLLQIPCGCGSVLIWRHCTTLCTSSFMDDVTFGRSGPYGDACDTGAESDVYECLVRLLWRKLID